MASNPVPADLLHRSRQGEELLCQAVEMLDLLRDNTVALQVEKTHTTWGRNGGAVGPT